MYISSWGPKNLLFLLCISPLLLNWSNKPSIALLKNLALLVTRIMFARPALTQLSVNQPGPTWNSYWFMLDDFSRVYITNIVDYVTNCFCSSIVSRFVNASAKSSNANVNYYKRDFLWLELASYMLLKNNHVWAFIYVTFIHFLPSGLVDTRSTPQPSYHSN